MSTVPAELDDSVGPSAHRLSAAARAFKTQALNAPHDPDAGSVGETETFRCGVMATPSVAADLIPASLDLRAKRNSSSEVRVRACRNSVSRLKSVRSISTLPTAFPSATWRSARDVSASG